MDAEDAKPADENGHLRSCERQQLGPIDQQLFLAAIDLPGGVVSETVRGRLEHGKRLNVGQRLGGVGTAGRKRDGDLVSGPLGSLFHGGRATEHDQIGKRHLLSIGPPRVEFLLNTFD